MDFGATRRTVLLTAMVLLSLWVSLGIARAETVRFGLLPWSGYELWSLAKAKGIFEKHGLNDVELITAKENVVLNTRLTQGDLQAANLSVQVAMQLFARGVAMRGVFLTTVSFTSDAIIAHPSITSVEDLRGKRVTFEPLTPGELLLRAALRNNGMTLADIKPLRVPAADAPSAVLAGRADAAVSYEPYLAEARSKQPSLRTIFSAADEPGLVSDFLVLPNEIIETRPELPEALIAVWQDALLAYRADEEGGRAIMAKALDLPSDEIDKAFEGLQFFSLPDNRQLYRSGELRSFETLIEEAAFDFGLLEKPVEGGVFDPRFIEAK